MTNTHGEDGPYDTWIVLGAFVAVCLILFVGLYLT